ncbi:MAG TPA: class I SAM-dependent RNA methyltransferase [Ktedonobacterales bacterium]
MPTIDERAPATQMPPLRFAVGRYRVRVSTLDDWALARADTLETLISPLPDLLELIPDQRRASAAQEHFTFIGGLPGELVEIEARWRLPREGRKRPRHLRPPDISVFHVVEASPQRRPAPCAVFGVCGGCQLQHMGYEHQLAWKRDHVRGELVAAGLGDVEVLPTVGATEWGYRNHMRFSVSRDGAPGMTARGSSRVLPLAHCPIASPRINEALAVLSRTPQPRPQALVRTGEATGQLLVQPAPDAGMAAALAAEGLDLRTDWLEEDLLGARFKIRPSSFFQTNTRQAETLAHLALSALPSGPDATVVDAYCGVGTFAKLMGGRVGHIIAIEESASAVRDAHENLDGVPGMEIIQGKVEDVLPMLSQPVDGLIIDPPRAGCQRPVLDALIQRQVPTVVYVSCSPQTLARDLAILRVGGFAVASVQPVDMFPQTAHVESVAVLRYAHD